MMLRVIPYGQLIGLRPALTCCSFLPVNSADNTKFKRTLKVFGSCEVKPKHFFQSKNILLLNSLKTLQSPRANVNLKEWTATSSSLTKLPKIYASLSKWYLTLFVAVTMDAGFCLAPLQFDQITFLLTTLGTILCSSSANTLNQIFEVPYDAQMDRTMNRPLVRHLVTPFHAACFAGLSGTAGFSLLYFGGNPLTAWLGLSTILLYAWVYTPLKRKHWSNTWVGSVVGAIPPLMGWTAATGSLDAGAFILSGILFAWQFPHFYALAWRRRGDYARGSYHMLPLTHPEATKHVVVGYSLMLWGLCSVAPITGVTSMYFAGMALPLNIWLTYNSIKFQRCGDSKSAQSLYKSTLYYILLISLAMVVDRKVVAKLEKDKIKLWLNRRVWAV